MSISSLNSDYGRTWGAPSVRTASPPATTSRAPSSGGSSGGGGGSNAMTPAGAAAFIAAIQAATAAGYSPSNPAPASAADSYTQQANQSTGYSGNYTSPSQLASRDRDEDSVYSSLLPSPLDKSNTAITTQQKQAASPKKYYVDEQGNIKSGQVTDMTKWYNDFKAQSGAKPSADDVRGAMDSYRGYVAGKTNPNSGDIWSIYGERIGNTGTGSGGYTDFSKTASNAIVNPNFVKTGDNDYAQRYLTATNGTEPGFMDYSTLGQKAQNWIKNNPGSLWDEQSLSDLWKTKYGDMSLIPSMMQKYSNEFGGTPPVVPVSNMASVPAMAASAVNPVPLTTVASTPEPVTNNEQTTVNASQPAVEWPTVAVTRPADPAYYQAGAATDPEAMMRQYYGDDYLNSLPEWQRQSILNALVKLNGGV